MKCATTTARRDGYFVMRQEARLRGRFKKIWKSQMDYVLEEAKKLSFFQKEDNRSVNADLREDEIRSLFNAMPSQELVAETIVTTGSAAMLKGGKTTVKRLNLAKFGINFSLKNPNAIRYLEERKKIELSNYRGNINNTTKRNLQRILVDAASTGQSYQKTAELIRDQAKAGVFSKARAELIATREIGVAYEVGNDIPIQDFKILHPDRNVLKYWQTVEDDRVTPTHRQNQRDGWIPYESVFSGTFDKHAPGSDNPRCRCFTKYEVR